MDDADMPKAQRLNEGLDDLVVWHWSVSVGCGWCGDKSSSSRGIVLPLYPIKVLVSDMFFLLLKLNYESQMRSAIWQAAA